MSDPAEFVCRGAPRDLGLDQAGVDPKAIRREARAARRGRGDSDRDERIARDVRRFFPHLSERIEGLARGSRARPRDLARILGRELALEDGRARRASAGLAVGVAGERTGAGPLLGRSLDLPRERTPRVRLRRSIPENDYRSLEVVVPWLVAPIAGVNEHGLAVTVTSVPPNRRAIAECLAPATLLAQDCLQRFDRVDKAMEWCERRPAGGSASLLLADAEGALAAVTVDGRSRRARPPGDGVLVGLGRSLRCTTVEKACLAAESCDVERLFGILRSHDGTMRGDDDSTCRHGEEQQTEGLVILDPARRRLLLVDEPPCRSSLDALRSVSV